MGNQNKESTKLRNLIAQAYVALPFIIAGEFLIDVGHLAIAGDFSEITMDVLWMMAFIFTGSAFMQMLVRSFDHRVFRWIVFGVTLLLVFAMLQHQLGHIGEYITEGINLHAPFDLAFDVIGIWTIILSWKWARLWLKGLQVAF